MSLEPILQSIDYIRVPVHQGRVQAEIYKAITLKGGQKTSKLMKITGGKTKK